MHRPPPAEDRNEAKVTPSTDPPTSPHGVWQVIAIAHVAVGELDDSPPRPGATRAGGADTACAGGGDTACAGVLDVSPSVHALADGLVALASSARGKMAGKSVGGRSSGYAAGEGRAPAVWVGVADSRRV